MRSCLWCPTAKRFVFKSRLNVQTGRPDYATNQAASSKSSCRRLKNQGAKCAATKPWNIQFATAGRTEMLAAGNFVEWRAAVGDVPRRWVPKTLLNSHGTRDNGTRDYRFAARSRHRTGAERRTQSCRLWQGVLIFNCFSIGLRPEWRFEHHDTWRHSESFISSETRLIYTPSKWQFICLEKKSTIHEVNATGQQLCSTLLLRQKSRYIYIVQRRKSPRKFRRACMSYDKSSPNNIAKVDWLGTPLCNQPVLMTILVQSNPEPSNYTVFSQVGAESRSATGRIHSRQKLSTNWRLQGLSPGRKIELSVLTFCW